MSDTVFTMVADIIDPPNTTGVTLFPKQRMAEDLSMRVDELLFGGAAGPGKTEWGLEHVIRQMQTHPKNHGIIFRRVYPSLEKSVIPRIKDKLHGVAEWNGGQRRFTFPNGSLLDLGHLQRRDSVRDYQGAQFGVIFFEELTEFLASQYTYMIHRLRSPNLLAAIRPHVISTTNPGGVGHTWVKNRFVRPHDTDVPPGVTVAPGRPWRPVATSEDPEPTSRVFVPATMADNPLLLERDPEYVNRVNAIGDRGLRRAMKTGDWDAIDAVENALWEQTWFDLGRVNALPTTPIRRVVALDPSDGTEAKSGDEFGVWAGCLGADRIAYTEFSDGWIMAPGKMARSAVELARDLHADAIVVEKNHGGAWIKLALLTADPSAHVQTVWASHGKRTRAEPVAALFDPDTSTDGSVRARLVGRHERLESECITFTGAVGEASPNRLDAMVWGHFALVLSRRAGPAKSRVPGGSLPRIGATRVR